MLLDLIVIVMYLWVKLQTLQYKRKPPLPHVMARRKCLYATVVLSVVQVAADMDCSTQPRCRYQDESSGSRLYI